MAQDLHQAWQPEFDPRIHVGEGENQFLQIIHAHVLITRVKEILFKDHLIMYFLYMYRER